LPSPDHGRRRIAPATVICGTTPDCAAQIPCCCRTDDRSPVGYPGSDRYGHPILIDHDVRVDPPRSDLISGESAIPLKECRAPIARTFGEAATTRCTSPIEVGRCSAVPLRKGARPILHMHQLDILSPVRSPWRGVEIA